MCIHVNNICILYTYYIYVEKRKEIMHSQRIRVFLLAEQNF